MRHMRLIGSLILATALASSAHVGWYVEMHGTTDSLTWQSADGPHHDVVSVVTQRPVAPINSN